jgi:hypothetical protein
MTRRSVSTASMIDQVATAIATADRADFESDPSRYRRLASAALKPLTRSCGDRALSITLLVRGDE